MGNGEDPNPIRLDNVHEAVRETPEKLVSDLTPDHLECLRIAEQLLGGLSDRGQKQETKPGLLAS